MGWGARGGKYGENTAGQKHRLNPDAVGKKEHLHPKTAGQKRHFIGSRLKKYKLTEKGKNPRTISASSIEEARRIAAALGYFTVKKG